MDIQGYIKGFSIEKGRLAALIGKTALAKKTNSVVFTDFLNPEEQRLLDKVCNGEGLKLTLYGGKGAFERAVGAIDFESYNGAYPIGVIRITGCFKFEKPDHRDYLGALMSQGIKREVIGDINVFDDGAEIWVLKDVESHICLNLDKVKHTGIKAQEIDVSKARERIQFFKDMHINAASMRLDAIASAITGASRAKISDMIKKGDIRLNYSETEDSSCRLEVLDILSIKGYGRYLVHEILGNTKSGRLSILVKKYI